MMSNLGSNRSRFLGNKRNRLEGRCSSYKERAEDCRSESHDAKISNQESVEKDEGLVRISNEKWMRNSVPTNAWSSAKPSNPLVGYQSKRLMACTRTGNNGSQQGQMMMCWCMDGTQIQGGIQQRVTKRFGTWDLTRTLSMLGGGRRKFTIVWSSHPLNYCQQKSKLEISKKFVVHKEFSVHVRAYPEECFEILAIWSRALRERSSSFILTTIMVKSTAILLVSYVNTKRTENCSFVLVVGMYQAMILLTTNTV